MDHVVSQSKGLRGSVTVPGDKSVSHRALMIGSLADGVSEIEGLSEAADPRSTLECLHHLGVKYGISQGKLCIQGLGVDGLRPPTRDLDAGNSGTTMRLMAGILAGQRFETLLTGDESLSRRPMKRIIDPLSKMGARIAGSPTYTAPLRIRGARPLQCIDYQLDQPSAQVKSAILFAGLYADGTTRVIEKNPTRDHTERMLDLATKEMEDVRIIEVEGGTRIAPRYFFVPGDISSAAFIIAAALLVPHSDVFLKNISLNPTRTGILRVLRAMGAKIHIERERAIAGEPVGDIHVLSSQLKNLSAIKGHTATELIDEIPILAVVGAFAEGEFQLRQATDLRNKESDRIRALVVNLSKLGLDVEEFDDGFAFRQKGGLRGTEFHSFGDHRIAMAFGVAALALRGESTIRDSGCVDISFPDFWQTVSKLSNS